MGEELRSNDQTIRANSRRCRFWAFKRWLNSQRYAGPLSI